MLSAVPMFSSRNDYEILVKDGSSGSSVETVVQAFISNLNLVYIHQGDTGIYDAWNQALDHVLGQWVFFLGADDRFISDVDLDALMDCLSHSDKPLVCVPVLFVFGQERALLKTVPKQFNYRLGCANPFYHQGVFHDARALKKIKFDPWFRICGDFNAMVQLCMGKRENVLILDAMPIVEMHWGGVSSLAKNNFRRLKERARVRKLNHIKTHYPTVAGSYIAASLKFLLLLVLGEEAVSRLLFRSGNYLRAISLCIRDKNDS